MRCVKDGEIGEVVNTPDCGSGMHEFDPHISPQFKSKRTCKKVLFMLICMWMREASYNKKGNIQFLHVECLPNFH